MVYVYYDCVDVSVRVPVLVCGCDSSHAPTLSRLQGAVLTSK